MKVQAHSEKREKIVAETIREVVSELRMVDVADYVAFMRLEHFSAIADIVNSAAERHLMPGTLQLGHGGDVHVSWSEPPKIVLDLELKPRGASVYFALSMSENHAGVEVNYVSFDEPDTDPERNTDYLRAALEDARIRAGQGVGP
jgi:hypothetical protein